MDSIEGAVALKQALREQSAALAMMRERLQVSRLEREAEQAELTKAAAPGEGIGAALDRKV